MGTEATAIPSDDLSDWKHMTTRDRPITDGDPMLSTYEFMNVRTGAHKTTVAYSLDEAEQKIVAEG